MLAIDDLILQVPDQLGLGFESREIDRAWAKEGEYSHDGARWNAWLNRLCLEILVPRLAEESGNDARVWPSEADLPSIWEFVNGTAITLGNRRIVLIPSEAFDIEEFCVPKEWVDIPNWTANYYLAVQVDPDDCWLRVWGYATHEMLKSKGIYNEFEGVYSLEREDVIEDLDVMWVAGQFCPEEKSEVEPLAALSPERVESLLAQLSQPSLYSPRLDVDFQQWAALLENHTTRRQLYQRRLGKSVVSVEKKLVNLSQWLENVFEEGWLALKDILSEEQVELGFSFRGASSLRSAVKAERGKLIDLGIEEPVALRVTVTPKADSERDILLQVCPRGDRRYLPPNLQLIALDESGSPVIGDAGEPLTTQAESDTNCIQLLLYGQPGERFRVKVALGNASATEEFVI